jgi:hypothetical protein
MTRKLEHGSWAQVLGTFDLESKSGAITSLQPARLAFKSVEGGEERLRIKGFDNMGQILFDEAVNPMRNSCLPRDNAGTFEEFVPVTPSLEVLRLFIDGTEVADYRPGRLVEPSNITMGFPVADKPHRIPIRGQSVAEPNVTYTIQARPKGDNIWHTVGIGLPSIDLGEVDINQFPKAQKIEIRILQTNGLNEREVFHDEKEF